MTSFLIMAAAALAAGLGAWWVMRAFVRGTPENTPAARPFAVLGFAGAGALLSLGLYLGLGRPDLPDQPYQARLADVLKKDPTQMGPEEVLAVLSERARKDPKDYRPHLYTGDVYSRLEMPQEAARAYDAALRRAPRNPEAMIGLGRSLVALGNGGVSEEALALFQAAAIAAPDDPVPWLYQGLAANQTKRFDDALKLWPEVARRLPKEDPRQQMVAIMLAEAETGARGQN